ncbi:MAG: ABC transporter permease subunit [Candidatus Hydrogenedentota bacterium]
MLNRVIIYKELKEFFSDIRLSLPSILMCIFVPCLAVTFINILFVLFTEPVYEIPLKKLYYLCFLFVSSFPLSLTIPIALESFVGEKERKTFEILLSLPVSEKELYISKLFSAFIIPATLGLCSLLLFYVLTLFYNLSLPYQPYILLIFTLLLIKSVLLVSSSCIISIGTSTIRAANVASSLVILPGTLLLGLESYLLYTGRLKLLACYIISIFLYALLFICLGLKTFNREDQIIFKNELSFLKNLFLKNISIKNISKSSISIVLISSIIGFVGTIAYLYLNDITPDILSYSSSISKINIFYAILKHNIRAFIALGILSLISFGVIPCVSSFFTGVITGILIFSTLNNTQTNLLTVSVFIPLFPKNILFLIVEIPLFIFLMILSTETGLKVFSDKNPGFLNAGIPLLKRYYLYLIILFPLLIISAFLETYFL